MNTSKHAYDVHDTKPSSLNEKDLVDSASQTPAASERAADDLEAGVGEKQGHDGAAAAGSSPEHVKFTTLQWIGFCLGLYLPALLYGLDTTIAADVQGAILESLGNIDLLPWIGIGFLLGSVATILPIGVMFGLFEVKWMFMGGIALFEIGSAVCGAAPSMSALTVGRVVAGVGGAGMYLGCLNYVAIFAPAPRRVLYIALIGGAWGLGAILGPVIGGAFAQSAATWRWAFYINLVIAGALLPIWIFWFPRTGAHQGQAIFPRLKSIDWLGSVLFAAIYAIFIVACTFCGTTYAWNSGSSITLWVFVGVTVLLFILQQWTTFLTTIESRIFAVKYLRSRTLILMYITTGCSAATAFNIIYYVPIFFQFTRGDGPIDAAVRLLPFICVWIFFLLLSGAVMPIFNLYAAWYVVGGILSLAGSVLLFLADANTSMAAIYGYEVLIAIGTGIVMQSGYSIAAAKVPVEEGSMVIGFINIGQLGSGAIALSIAGAVFQNVGYQRLVAAIGDQGFSSADIHGALAGTQSAVLANSTPAVRQAAIDAIAKTISSTYGIALSASAVLLLCGIFMRFERLKMA